MIAFVAGEIAAKTPEAVVIETGNGLGYRLLVPSSTHQRLPAEGEDVHLHTFLNVREDAMELFGFASEAERDVFETLRGVSGIGPKLALASLSALSPGELRAAVMDEDAGRLTQISGVGKKTAQRMIVNLGDKLQRIDTGSGDGALSAGGDAAKREARADALSALEEMGMSTAEAERALRKALRADADAQSSGELVRRALAERG
ncbi:MAG: Holliday junction branch migration protein RuvA [Bacteroidetes bacterium QS_9_68_14]|nr:MAG: Holliday junction branch migration protein RuvA [Bacteroidetes bacterium QS_9_68_14]